MLWFILFLLCIVYAVICVIALALWLAAASVNSLLTCIERSLANLGNGLAANKNVAKTLLVSAPGKVRA
jgi:hypothetical protein